MSKRDDYRTSDLIIRIVFCISMLLLSITLILYFGRRDNTDAVVEQEQEIAETKEVEEEVQEEPAEPEWMQECREMHLAYGYDLCQDSESHRMLRRDLSSTSTSGSAGNQMDIADGIDWYQECKNIHDGSCSEIGEHEFKQMDLSQLYANYDAWNTGISREDINSRVSYGCYHGFEYCRFSTDMSVDSYIQQFAPTDSTYPAWIEGFNYTYNKYI